MHNVLGIEVRNAQRGDIIDQGIRPHVLPDRDENRAAEQLDEHDNRGADGHVDEIETRLGGDTGLLEAEARAEAEDDLVADPLGGGDVDSEGGEEAGADGHEDDGGVDEGHVVTDFRGQAAGDDGADDLGEDEGEVVDAGVDGVDAVDGLEPDGEVVDEEEEGGADAKREDAAEGDAALAGDAGGNWFARLARRVRGEWGEMTYRLLPRRARFERR